ncbi:hypothetical protein EVAR_30749_1 [Eumeta japonica]|uniref:Integrase zinc-binding domain-containing protein n=1 Tax=Eumeta variegata TaxID=151549 RepID=A0A4C1V6Y8_EUMVA|nr:hypothetical protein EVAR_30749_1 [Eumeta japonica]
MSLFIGLIWEPECDSLGFDVTFKKLPRDIINGKNKPTKRQFLSLIMSIFDPLDLLCPVTIKGKILMQRIWRSGIGWDDVLHERDYARWVDYLDEVRKLSQLRIPRCYALRTSKIELHVFGDASEHAYVAVAYWRAVRPDGTVHLALVAGKSRVAPNKVMSIPRLELQAALLACRLATNIQKEDRIAAERRMLWCDSKTVLRWIRSDPRAYKPFVAHRLAELDERSDHAWPIDNDVINERVADDEAKGESINVVCTTHTGDVIDVTRFSSWTRLVRTYARVLYFTRRLRKQQRPFDADDVVDDETRLLRASQRRAFSDEMRAAAVGAATHRESSLRALDVMLTDGWLRVGGRLRRSPTLSFEEKHLIILDGLDHAVRLLVEHYHRRAGHANHDEVVNIIRERFWITRLRPTVKKVANACRLRRVRRARPVTPKMTDLPKGASPFVKGHLRTRE